MSDDDRHDLARFTHAQDEGRTYEHAIAELRAGRKTSHWMWFVFPQIAGLGRSATAQHFAIASLEEAKAYARHPVLGPRLTECTRLVAEWTDRTAEEIFGAIDSMKLRSSMTLFARAVPDDELFAAVLERCFGGVPDPATEARL